MDKPSLKQFADQWRKSAEHTEALRIAVANAIRTANQEGMPQKDIAEATGYTRQQIRRIVNADAE
ncbi:helix-turn-helix domain-containing protein [Nocardiopsis changdeensis]|uniref:Helix-turn-helix domain-containing protein n=1 Tax=Nocardiopsis changdeensis TaxID=2831969 RepID=A0ABX8BE89_9ACTN|nr:MULTISPECIES: helix-turn-helix domain-containing protein [Nocardiopsis]QUX20352.1 helix-turn-helix domain-containing protein [Nocardiopsis changdeensis]QYX36282.1 helix-turn-helix domain-containing protein [Nocardiopsis sp. MT53]